MNQAITPVANQLDMLDTVLGDLYFSAIVWQDARTLKCTNTDVPTPNPGLVVNYWTKLPNPITDTEAAEAEVFAGLACPAGPP